MENEIPATPRRKRKPKPPDPEELVAYAVEAGDLELLKEQFKRFTGSLWTPTEKTAKFEQALQSIYNRGGPQELVRAVIEQILKLDAILLMGTQLEIESTMKEPVASGAPELSTKNVPPSELDKLARVQSAFLGVSKSAATVLHVLALAERDSQTTRIPRSGQVVRIADSSAEKLERAHG